MWMSYKGHTMIECAPVDIVVEANMSAANVKRAIASGRSHNVLVQGAHDD